MSKAKPRACGQKLGHLLAEVAPELARAAESYRALAGTWATIAPRGCAERARPGVPREGVLTLYCDDGAVAARIKQQLPRLLLHFRQRGHDLTAIAVKVQVAPPPPPASPAARRPRLLPAGALAEFAALSARLPPSPLKAALERMLARRSREPLNK